jgi:hypothetical protein
MSVTIDKLVARCHVSRRRQAVARSADRVARQRLATALTQLVGPALSRQPAIVRIRRLSVKLVLTDGELEEDALAAAWARALARSLFEALAQPAGSGSVQIVRASGLVEFRAAFLRDLLAGQAGGRWEYAEFDDLLRQPVAEAALTLLLDAPASIRAILAALDRAGLLERLLVRFEDLHAERLFIALAEAGSAAGSGTLSVADLIWAARQTAAAPVVPGFAMDSRRQALRLFIRAQKSEGRSPRLIFHALRALTCLLECPQLLDPAMANWPQRPEEIESRLGHRLPPAVAAFLLALHRARTMDSPIAEALHAALDVLRPLVPTAAPATVRAQAPWLVVDSAGLLLLTGIVQRLGWHDLRRHPSLAMWSEPRLFQVLLLGVGSAILERNALTAHALDPAVLHFAGIEQEADRVWLQHALAGMDATDRCSLLQHLAPAASVAHSADWPAAFDALADCLLREFASLVRGFGKASRPAIVRQFVRTPGRVQVREDCVAVLLEPSPFHVALHISGLDDPLPSVSWMKGRRLQFRLLGL